MTFRQLLDEIQYGKEYMKKEANKKAILENYDEEIQMFKASSRIKKIAKEKSVEALERLVDIAEDPNGRPEHIIRACS